MKTLRGSSYPKYFLKITGFSKNAKSMKKGNWIPATNLSPTNFAKIKTLSQVASKHVVKVLIYHSVNISLNSGTDASKMSNK